MSILNVVLASDNQAGAYTIRDYLKALVAAVWQEGEGFSGKRPFGNSGWEYDLYYPLVRDHIVYGQIDAYGDVVDVDRPHADRLIAEAIRSL